MSSLVVCPHCHTRVLPMAGRICPACRKDVDAPPAEPMPERAAEAVYGIAVEQMLQGGDPSAIKASLTRQGLDAEAAAGVVAQVKQERIQARRVEAQKKMFYGAFWCIGGLAVTVLTYQAAAGGGRFVIAWGAVVFGAFQFLRGLTLLAGE